MRTRQKWRTSRWIVVFVSLLLGWASASAQSQNRAGLVIQRGDGRVATYCVRFTESSITGLDLLTRAGLSVNAEIGGLGSAVCAIGGEGCAYPSQPCFCQCQGADCAYWNYLHLIDGRWRYSSIGAAGYTITDGAVDAWVWGNRITPPVYTIDQICSEPAVAPTAPPVQTAPPATATNTPSPTPRSPDTLEVTRTPQPATPTFTASPTIFPTDAPTAVPAAHSATGDGQVDFSSYAIFAMVIIVLGGWLIVNRIRRG